MKVTSFIVLALYVCCTVAELNTRIVGGKDATLGQFPYQATLREKGYHYHFCSGSILSSRFLLTAAHCTHGWFTDEIYAAVGTLHSSIYSSIEDGVVVQLEKFIEHEDFNVATQMNDISLIRTVEDILFTDVIQPIALPIQNLADDKNINVTISGWGMTSMSTVKSTLQYALVRTISNEICKNELKKFFEIQETNICTFQSNKIGLCFGDSGKNDYNK